MFLDQLPEGVAILFTFLALFVTIGLGFLFFWLIKKNLEKEKEESEVIIEDAVTKKQMEDSVVQYIKKVDRFGALTLIYVDIDGFSDLNEVFGKEACDQMLKEAATRIMRVLPYKASFCRYVNDEFLIFIKDEDNKARIEKLAMQLLEIINNPYQVLVGEAIRMSASVGIVTYPIAGENFETLYNNLLLTTYVSKRDGGNKFTDFYASIVDEETSNMAYFQEVKSAIQKDEFTLYYQPILDMENNLIQGCECLMRWNHPEKGVQSPATFLKVLEQSGDIGWVGRWGLQEMIKMHDILAQKFQEIPLRFSLNLSTKQLLDPDLANTFIDIINKANVKPDDFMLEVNDFMMLEKIAVVKTNIYKLRDFGFKIAVDGFEVDGQSVQAIQRAPIDVIKLGRNFLKDIENNFMKERLLEILVKFATENNRTLVSEGVETPEVAKYVKEQNVFLEQGYLFGKPMSAEAFTEYIEKHQYRVILEDVTNLEDTEKIMQIVNKKSSGGEEEAVETTLDQDAVEAEQYLDSMVQSNQTETVEAEDSQSVDMDDMFEELDDSNDSGETSEN